MTPKSGSSGSDDPTEQYNSDYFARASATPISLDDASGSWRRPRIKTMLMPVIVVQALVSLLAAQISYSVITAINIRDLGGTGPSPFIYGSIAAYCAYASGRVVVHNCLVYRDLRWSWEVEGAYEDFLRNFSLWLILLMVSSFAVIVMGTLGGEQPTLLFRFQDSILAIALSFLPLETLINGGILVHEITRRRRNFGNAAARLVILSSVSFAAILPHQVIPIRNSLEWDIIGAAIAVVLTLYAVVYVFRGPRDYY